MRWPNTPSPEIPLQENFLFFGLSEQVQRKKRNGENQTTMDFFVSSWGGGGISRGAPLYSYSNRENPLEKHRVKFFFFFFFFNRMSVGPHARRGTRTS